MGSSPMIRQIESPTPPVERSRDLFELAAGFAEESVIVTTPDLDAPGPTILYVNDAYTKMTGYSASEVLGRSPRFMQGPRTRRSTLDRLKEAINAGEDFIAREINYRRDGTPFELEWIITHLRDAQGRTTHLIAVQRDITGIERAAAGLAVFDEELRVLGSRLLRALATLHRTERQMARSERMNALGRMARGITHDLQDSLAPIAWMLDFLDEDPSLGNEARSRVDGIRSNLEHAMSLNQRLRDFAGTDAATDSETSELPAREIIAEAVDLVSSQRSRSGQPIEIQIDAEPGLTLDVQPTECRQVLVNLALNAIDAMPDGGTLTFRADSEETGTVIEVIDTGEGMSDEMLEHCFDPFFTTRDHGTGLGLSICHGIVERHGGRIDVSSVTGSGTTFCVHLPARGAGADRVDPCRASSV